MRRLLVVLFILFLEEQVGIFSLLMMMKENLHCLNAWFKTTVICISCMFVASYISFLLYMEFVESDSFKESSCLLISLCRSALRAFKRRFAYSNVDYDRIRLICFFFKLILGAFSFLHCILFFMVFLYKKKKILLAGEHHPSDVRVNLQMYVYFLTCLFVLPDLIGHCYHIMM